jgi:RNA polymerase sigma-70 factor (ECF subfamily)
MIRDLRAVAAGDAAATDAFYRRWAPEVLRWVIRLGGPHLDAEDVAQNALVTAITRAGSFRGRSSVRTWVFGVTRGVVRNARRRAAIRRVFGLSEIPEPASHALLPDDELARLRRRRQVQRALDQLSTAHREVVVLADLEGHTAPEVSELLGIPVGTVYSRLHTGRRRLTAALAAEGITAQSEATDHTVIPLRRPR